MVYGAVSIGCLFFVSSTVLVGWVGEIQLPASAPKELQWDGTPPHVYRNLSTLELHLT